MSWLSKGWLGRAWTEFRHRRHQGLDDEEDFLLVTWDSCRYDTYQAARTPVLDRFGRALRGWAMATYTLPSHQAMFCGFLPHVFEPRPLYNRFCGQLWRISHRHVNARPLVMFPDGTENVVCGFRRRGYFTAGTAAMEWFARPSPLQNGFDWFEVRKSGARRQIESLIAQVRSRAARRPCFAFANFGETHSPFRHEGMPEARDGVDRQFSLARLYNQHGLRTDAGSWNEPVFQRQLACAEYLDAQMEPLLDFFRRRGRPTTVVVCSDHGECMGENGLYGHALYHEKVMEVPILIFRLNAAPHPTAISVVEKAAVTAGHYRSSPVNESSASNSTGTCAMTASAASRPSWSRYAA